MSDLISRQAAIDALCNQCSMTKAGDRCVDDFCRDVRALKEVPFAKEEIDSAYAEGYTLAESKYREYLPKTGEWIREDDEQCYWYQCSECGHYPPKDTFKQEWLSDFCPNCGADMRKGKKKDDRA